MRHFVLLGLALPLVLSAAATLAQSSGEQQEARKELRAGNIRMRDEIERRIIPRMQGWQYLGFDYDKVALAYRLRFIRDGKVVFVDVDARSGAVLNQTR